MEAYGVKNCFNRASQGAVVVHMNNAPKGDGGVDQAAQETLDGHGICSGITSTWVIGFVNGNEGAHDTREFTDYFRNTLRFQGAYLKEVGGRIKTHLEEILKAKLEPNVKKAAYLHEKKAEDLKLPSNDWAGYAAIWHHAVGIGSAGGKFYIMDPNYGLYKYEDKEHFVADLGVLVEARRKRKEKDDEDKIKVFCYTKK